MFSRYPDEKSRKKKQDERAPNPGPGLGTANIHLKCNRSDMNSRHFRPAKTPLPSTRCRRMSDSIFKERSGYERSGYVFAFSRRETPELYIRLVPPKTEGAGKAGCSARTRGPCALVESTRSSPQVVPDHPAFPAQWF